MMKVAYIAAPYRAPTLWGIVQNIRRAEAVALQYWKRGYAVICPHKNTAFFDGAVAADANTRFADSSVWLAGGLEILRRLRPGYDVLVLCPRWEASRGTCSEKALAENLGILIEEASDGL